MIKVVNNHTDPRINLALEEYVLNYLDPSEEYAILWQNEPTVVIGRNQNTVAEVNAPLLKKRASTLYADYPAAAPFTMTLAT